MKLIDFRVRSFRNVLDSGRIAVEPDITCLVGKNESGKTALLEALLRVKPSAASPLDPTEHYPRWLLTQDRRDGGVDAAAAVEARFELGSADRAAMDERFGPGVVRGSTFVLGLRYGGPYGSVDIDTAQAVRNVLDHVDAGTATREALVDAATLPQLLEMASGAEDAASDRRRPGGEQADTAPAGELAAVRTRVSQVLGDAATLGEAVLDLLHARTPTFLYFDDYAILPGRIPLEQLATVTASDPEYLNAARALLRMAGADAESLIEGAYEERRAELETVSNAVTDEVFTYWTQEQGLDVEIDVDLRSVPRGAARNVIEHSLEIRVRDPRRGFTTNFGQRSSGFQWFFSFLAAASAFDRFPGGVVVLLDEPALTLHPSGQADLQRFIEQRIAPEAQVIYTTHSPFMVNPAHLERIRMVEDRGLPAGAVVVSDPSEAAQATLAPLQTALSMEVGRALFDRGTNLVVRDAADLTYLTVMSDRLARRGRTHLDGDWRVLPSGDAHAIPVMTALLGQAADVTVLLGGRIDHHLGGDGGSVDTRRIVSLEELTSTQGATIEDLFSDVEYLRMFNRAFGTRLRAEQIDGDGPVLERVGGVATDVDFDRQRPAAVFARHARLNRRLSRDTMERFETLFEHVAATLR